MAGINIQAAKSQASKQLLLWAVFILYVLMLSYAVAHHELWADEIHSWNIAKGSTGFSDLIANTRYEGHPPAWYIVLWAISKFTHDVSYIQSAQLIIAITIVFLVLFFSPFTITTRILIPFGYYFLFEYGALSRNYAIGILPAFVICLILHKNFRCKIPLYYLLLFITSNAHLIALLLAFSLHMYFLWLNIEAKKKTGTIIFHLVAGAIVLLPSLYFIFPPPDSQLNTQSLLHATGINPLANLIQPPLRAFVPVPAWWNYNFWNTQFLLELQPAYPWFKIITVLVLLALSCILFLILKENKKSAALFVINLSLSLAVSVFFLLGAQRYAGFIFIGFIAAYWLYCAETPISRRNKWLVTVLLCIQLAGGVFAVVKDTRLPFSNASRVTELLDEVPPGKRVVTDYWALNSLAAFKDEAFYVLEMRKDMSFLVWNTEFTQRTQAPDRYSNSVKYLFQKENLKETYMISVHSPGSIYEQDAGLFKLYNVALMDSREGAIEKSGNLYLYRIYSH